MRSGKIILFCLIVCLVFVVSCTATDSPEIQLNETATPTAEPIATDIARSPTNTPAPTSTSISTPLPSPTTTPDVPIEEVTFNTEDGVDIAATLFGEGDLAVLLLHMGKGKATGNDQEDWHPFARALAEQGYTALTIDFRGRGSSGGEFANDPVTLDAQAALDFLRERGFTRFVCIGAGVGGTTCMHLTLTEDLAGLVVLSSSLSAGPTNQVTEADLLQLTIPKLYLYGSRDGFGFPEAMENIYRVSGEPKELITCESAAHGSDLLYGSCGDDIYQGIITSLEELE